MKKIAKKRKISNCWADRNIERQTFVRKNIDLNDIWALKNDKKAIIILN